MNKKDFSIVIPVYNGEKTIELLYERIVNFFSKTDYSYEIIFVYDGGIDNSWEVIKRIKERDKNNVIGIKLSRNFGQHNAIIAGIKYANGNYIITMDEDLQHDPQDIALLIKKQHEADYDVVYGKFIKLKHNLFRRITSRIMKMLLKFAIPELNMDYSAFRLIKGDIAKEILNMNNSYTFLDGYLSWITTHTSSIEVSHNKRIAGESSYNLIKLINHSLNIFFTFSFLPIRILTFTSIFILILSSIFALYIFFKKIIFNNIIPGYTSLIIVTTFGIGLIMFSLGILGEYLHRVNLKTTKRPNFIIKEKL